jgi:plastocyanin
MIRPWIARSPWPADVDGRLPAMSADGGMDGDGDCAVERFRARIGAVLATVAAGAALLSTGCTDGSRGALSSTPPARPGSAVPGGTTLTVTEKEYWIGVSAVTIAPGTYTVEVDNRGKMSHNLNIKGPAVDNWRSPTVPPGTTSRAAVTLQRGTYELWCSIDHHKLLGMDTKILVT